MELNKNKVGLSFAVLLGSWHLLWSLLVATGLAQALLDFVYWVHFLNNPFTVGNFEPVTSLVLIAVTSCVGYVFGWILAFVWNWMHKR